MRERSDLIAQAILFLELVCISLAFVLAYFLFPVYQPLFTGGDQRTLFPLQDYLWFLVAFLLLWPVLIYREIQREFIGEGYLKIARKTAKAGVIGFAMLAFLIFITRTQWVSRLFIVTFGGMSIALLTLQRWGITFYLRRVHWRGDRRRRIVVIGSMWRAQETVERISRAAECEIVGCFDPNPTRVGMSVKGVKVLGTVDQVAPFILSHPVDEVVVAMPLAGIPEAKDVLEFTEKIGMKVRIMPDFQVKEPGLGSSIYKVRLEEFYGVPALTFSATRGTLMQLMVKRLIDIVAAAILLMVSLPLFMVIGVLVKLTSRGPIFYKWKVMGKNNREFVGYKFRSMVEEADGLKAGLMDRNEMKGAAFKMAADPRVTWVGRFLRKYSLDELPQLYSVLKGDMSLVGPRPPFREELERFEFWQRRKLSVRPGLTCLWQVDGRNSVNDFSEWARMDLEYIDNWSLMVDFKILAKTVLVVLKGTGR